MIEVVRAGPLTTVQDLGRPGYAHLGVPRSGALDVPALRRANALVGNPESAAALETTLLGCRLRFTTAARVAVTGAPAELRVDGEVVDGVLVDGVLVDGVLVDGVLVDGVLVDGVLELAAGAVLDVGKARGGVRSYVAVAGGIAVEPVLGSRSTDTLSGLGPPPLRNGMTLPVGPVIATPDAAVAEPTTRAAVPPPGETSPPQPPTAAPTPPPASLTTSASPSRSVPPPPLPSAPSLTPSRSAAPSPLAPEPHPLLPCVVSSAGELVLGVWVGPREEWVDVDGLFAAAYTVSPVGNRVGARLVGPGLRRVREGELPPEGVVLGAIQVPADGQPLIFLADHPTTGGYPVIGVVVDVTPLAQARPGTVVRFVRE